MRGIDVADLVRDYFKGLQPWCKPEVTFTDFSDGKRIRLKVNVVLNVVAIPKAKAEAEPVTLQQVYDVIGEYLATQGQCEVHDATGKGVTSLAIVGADRTGDAVKLVPSTETEGG